jgi:hypothetical protein
MTLKQFSRRGYIPLTTLRVDPGSSINRPYNRFGSACVRLTGLKLAKQIDYFSTIWIDNVGGPNKLIEKCRDVTASGAEGETYND